MIGGQARGYRASRGGGGPGPRSESGPFGHAATALRMLAGTAGQELTYTCVPPGSGRRIGIDRDLDGVLDGDE